MCSAAICSPNSLIPPATPSAPPRRACRAAARTGRRRPTRAADPWCPRRGGPASPAARPRAATWRPAPRRRWSPRRRTGRRPRGWPAWPSPTRGCARWRQPPAVPGAAPQPPYGRLEKLTAGRRRRHLIPPQRDPNVSARVRRDDDLLRGGNPVREQDGVGWHGALDKPEPDRPEFEVTGG